MSTPKPDPGARRYFKPQARPDEIEIRLIGTTSQVTRAASRITHVLDVLSQSRPIPRRQEPGRVSLFLRVRDDQQPEQTS
ncbi:hypothetical protein ACWDA3_25915 [Nonomuraea rubra]